MTDETVISPRDDDSGSSGRSAADIDERVLGEAVGRGYITKVQGREALDAARAGGKSLLEVLKDRGLVSDDSARVIDDEVKEDFVPGYKIVSKLGEGGMGMVYKALQKRLDREVALKVVMPRLASDTEYLKRFEREAKAVAKLNHPNIVAAYDFGESHGRVYFAMEYVEGINLADALYEKGRMDEGQAISIVREVCAGLAHAAASGITHRDIKPANILLAKRAPGSTASGSATGTKITDLGLARVGEAQGGSELTQAGTILGTPGYMAPEQAMGEPVDLRADIYAVGATLYQMVTGLRPFEASTPVAMIAKQQTQQLEDPRDHVPNVSAPLVALLQGMMAKDPESRYADYKTLLEDVDRVRMGEAPRFPVPPRGHISINLPKDPGALAAAATMVTAPGDSPGGSRRPDTGTVAMERPDSQTRAPAPASSKMGPILIVCVLAAAAGAFVIATKPWKDKPAPVDPSGGNADPSTDGSDTDRSGADDPGGDEPDVDPEPLPDVAGDLQLEEMRRRLERLAEMRRRYDSMPPAKRKLRNTEGRRVQGAVKKAQMQVEGRIKQLWSERRYGDALELGLLAQKTLGKEHAGSGIDTLVKNLGAIGRKEAEEEAAVLEVAESAIAKDDPLTVIATLQGFGDRFRFSPKREWAESQLAQAERDAPEVTIESTPPDATIQVDGAVVGKTPLARRVRKGRVVLRLEREGYEPLERTVEVKPVLPQEFSYTLTPLPAPDPDPAVELVRDGDPRPLWFGSSLGSWSTFKGSWAVSDPTRDAELEGKKGKEPAAMLRGAGRTLSMARLDLAKFVEDAPGWKLEWMMMGARASTGSTARVEMHFCVCDNDTALVLGIDDQDAYLGRRDLSTGTLKRLRRWEGIAAGERHTFAVEDHGDVFRIFIDGYRKGSVAAPANRNQKRTIRTAVEDGVGFFSDIVRWVMKKP